MRQIDATVRGVGPLALIAEDVEVVAAHPSHDGWPYTLDFGMMFRGQRLRQIADLFGASACSRLIAEVSNAAVGQPRLSAQHVVHHIAVSNRA